MTSKESFEDTRLDTEYVPDQDCARDDWVQGNPSGLARVWQFFRKNTSTRCYYVAGFIVVVLLLVSPFLVSGSEHRRLLKPCPFLFEHLTDMPTLLCLVTCHLVHYFYLDTCSGARQLQHQGYRCCRVRG